MNHHVRTVLPILAGIALAGTALPAFAEQLTLHAMLSGAEEVPANDSVGTGTVDATYDTDANTLTYTISYSGLTGEATAAHFHGPAPAGENAPPVVPIDADLTSPISGEATLTDEQETDLLAGMWYFNVHTVEYPDGEIRGQVLQAMASSESSAASSEPSTLPSSEPSSSEMSSSSAADTSSLSSDLSSAVSSLSSELVPSVSASASVSASGEVSVSP